MAFELYAATHGRCIQGYHTDYGRFADNAFIDNVKKQRQSVTFCGVIALHQNGIAKKRIQDLQDKARVIMMQEINK